jgi:hypothetical protein
MPYNQEPNNNDSAGSFSAKQTQQLNKLNQVAGNGIVPLTDNRKLNLSRGGKEYAPKFRKTDAGKYIRNTSPAAQMSAIKEDTSAKYAAINKKVDRDRQAVKKMDYQRKQNFNPFRNA